MKKAKTLAVMSLVALSLSACGSAKKNEETGRTGQPQNNASIAGSWQLSAKDCAGRSLLPDANEQMRIAADATSVAFIFPGQKSAEQFCKKVHGYTFILASANSSKDSAGNSISVKEGALSPDADRTVCWDAPAKPGIDEATYDETQTLFGDRVDARITQRNNEELQLETTASPYCRGQLSRLKFTRVK
ncbi:MAG: hypothetical protein EOP11_16280 [Proteobacteria bacterium]|nr:MAG: hypothetical protein EOP11_16280 [Pseudomonadota bacterium]